MPPRTTDIVDGLSALRTVRTFMTIHLTKFCEELPSTLLDCRHLIGVSCGDRNSSFRDEKVLSAKLLLYSHSHGLKKGKLGAAKKSGDAAQRM